MESPILHCAPNELCRKEVHWRKNMFIGLALISLVFSAYLAYGALQDMERERVSALAYASLPEAPEAQEMHYGIWPALSDPDFFSSVKEKFVASRADFIEANLSTMKLTVFRGGKAVLEVPIKTKGRQGSWWETPSGLYKVGEMAKKGYSTFADVYMPWMIQFQGNFFIHGWPYYESGEPVSSTYSGGCVRLADEDAKAVWDLATKDMPILVYEEDFAPDSFVYSIAAPELSAHSYLAVDLRSNFVLLAGNERAQLPTSILPKIATALVASEYRNIEKEITVPSSALVPTAVPRLHAGATYSIYDLLWPLTLEDSAEAAETIASDFGVKEFQSLVGEKLASIGAVQSSLFAPSGVGAQTSAEDLFKVAKYLYNNRPFLLSLSSGTQRHAYGSPAFNIRMQSALPAEGLVGSLIGRALPGGSARAAASVSLVFASSTPGATVGARDAMAIYEMEFRSTKRPIAFIVLGSSEPTNDITLMREYVLSHYR